MAFCYIITLECIDYLLLIILIYFFLLYVINILLIRSYRNRRKLLFPILWSDAYMRASTRTIRLLKLITNLHFYCQLLGTFMIAATILIWLWLPARRFWLRRRYTQHMEINRIPNAQLVDENTEDMLEEPLKTNKESLLSTNNHFMRLY